MNDWSPIAYHTFWDFPRLFFVQSGSKKLLFDCPFNETEEEFEDCFKVYLMPDDFEQPRNVSEWVALPTGAEILLGEVPCYEVEFDPSRRQRINPRVLMRFGLASIQS